MKRYKLGEIADIVISNVDKKSRPNEKSIYLCNFTDVYRNWAIRKSSDNSYMKATANDNKVNTLLLKKGFVAFTKDSETRDDIGISTYIADDFDDLILGYHCVLVKPYVNILDGEYLNAFLHSKFAKKFFELNATGSGMRFTLSSKCLMDIPVLLPDLSEQQRIAKILSNIDAKIELNKKISRELETMSKELYDYWFVQFDFPNEQGKPYKSSGGKMVWNETLKREIPEGWEVSTVGKTINKIPNTARVPSSEYLRDGLIPVIDQSSDFIAGYTNDPDSVLKSKSGYIVFGDHTRIVKYIRFPYARGADGTQVLKSNNPCIPEELFYQIIKSIDLSNYGYARHFKFLKDTLIVIPEKNISGNFAEITKPIYEKQAKLVFENIELSKLRDWLLPMLMNGQVRVSEERVSSISQKDDTNRFILWKNTYPVAARGEKNDTVLRAMYEAMDDEDK